MTSSHKSRRTTAILSRLQQPQAQVWIQGRHIAPSSLQEEFQSHCTKSTEHTGSQAHHPPCTTSPPPTHTHRKPSQKILAAHKVQLSITFIIPCCSNCPYPASVSHFKYGVHILFPSLYESLWLPRLLAPQGISGSFCSFPVQAGLSISQGSLVLLMWEIQGLCVFPAIETSLLLTPFSRQSQEYLFQTMNSYLRYLQLKFTTIGQVQ